MPLTYPYQQYQGVWTLSQASDAVAQSKWPVPPGPALFAWGNNASGRLGLGNTTYYSSPKQVGTLITWSNIASGNAYGLAVKTDGTLWSWGNNSQGQLGLGNTTNYSSPKQIGVLTNWLKVACASYTSSAAIKTDGTLWTWGQNNFGQLGLGNTTSYSSPKQVGALTNWLQLTNNSAGSFIAVKTNGTLWAWGKNQMGYLGLGNTTYYSSPKQIGALTTWSFVASSNQSTFAIKTDGTLWSWGQNDVGQLALGNTTYYSSPRQIGALTNWSSVAGAVSSQSATKTDGSLWAWGWNNIGQLGFGDTVSRSSPAQVGSLYNWLKTSGGRQNTFAIKTDGTLWSWGKNDVGQLGLGNTTAGYSSPKQIGALTTWLSISSGLYSTLALKTT